MSSYAGLKIVEVNSVREACVENGFDISSFNGKANRFATTLGPYPARAWILMLRSDIDSLNINAAAANSVNDLIFTDGQNSLTAKDMKIVSMRRAVPGWLNDPNACYIVELADAARWQVHNPHHGPAMIQQFNVPAPAGGSNAYYVDSLFAGAPYTWQGLLNFLWPSHPLLGPSPQLPAAFTPDGNPENFSYYGTRSWEAYNGVLQRLGCALTVNPTQPAATKCSIVQVGVQDQNYANAQLAYVAQRLVDDEVIICKSAVIPASANVLFHGRFQHYGTEPTTKSGAGQWSMSSGTSGPVYQINVPEPNNFQGLDPNTSVAIWDDLSAVFDVNGNLTNLAALQSRATQRAADYYRMVEMTGTHQVFAGIINDTGFFPGPQVYGYAVYDTGEGFMTNIVRMPYFLRVDNHGRFVEVEDKSHERFRPPDLSRATFPNYPLREQPVLCGASLAGNLYNGTVQHINPAGFAQIPQESCFIYSMTGLALTNGHVYDGKLNGSTTSGGSTLPLYLVWGGFVDGGGQCLPNNQGISLTTY